MPRGRRFCMGLPSKRLFLYIGGHAFEVHASVMLWLDPRVWESPERRSSRAHTIGVPLGDTPHNPIAPPSHLPVENWLELIYTNVSVVVIVVETFIFP
jgi:hypothetical protein